MLDFGELSRAGEASVVGIPQVKQVTAIAA
jgi:hypothetical protein